MAADSRTPVWRIPWIEELGGLQSGRCKQSDTAEQLTLSHWLPMPQASKLRTSLFKSGTTFKGQKTNPEQLYWSTQLQSPRWATTSGRSAYECSNSIGNSIIRGMDCSRFGFLFSVLFAFSGKFFLRSAWEQAHPSGLPLFFPSFLLQEHTFLPVTLVSILGYSVIAVVKRDAVFWLTRLGSHNHRWGPQTTDRISSAWMTCTKWKNKKKGNSVRKNYSVKNMGKTGGQPNKINEQFLYILGTTAVSVAVPSPPPPHRLGEHHSQRYGGHLSGKHISNLAAISRPMMP